MATDAERQLCVCKHATVSNDHLDALRVSTLPTTLTVRPPDGLTQRLADVVIVAIDESTVTIDLPNGERRTIDVGTVVNVERERQRRKHSRAVGYVLDLLGLS